MVVPVQPVRGSTSFQDIGPSSGAELLYCEGSTDPFSDSDSVASDQPVVDLYPEEGELSDEYDFLHWSRPISLRRTVL